MKLSKGSKSILAALTVVSVVAACGKKKEEAAEPASASSVEDLKLSSTLAIEIPEALATAAGGSEATNLAPNLVGKKSSEACRTMEQTDSVLSNLKEIGNMFCHFEVESDKFKFGTKYNVVISGGGKRLTEGKTMNIWVDNSDAAEMKVYSCDDGKLTQSIKITGFGGKGKIKGTVDNAWNHVDEENPSVTYEGGVNVEFDFSQDGFKIVKAKMKNKTSGGQYSGEYANAADIKLVDSGVSSIMMSSQGTHQGNAMSDQGAVLFNGTFGQALYTGVGTYSGQEYNYTTRSTFGADGVTVAASNAPAEIIVDKSTLPAKLDATFAPTAATGWDCTGAEETITIDMTDASKKAAHDACSDHGRKFKSCWGDGFEQGERE